MSKRVLCLDFDGVCHSYVSGWQGATVIPDPPVDGLFEFLEEAHKHFELCIYSSRSHQEGGIDAMMFWFAWHAPWRSVLTFQVDAISWDDMGISLKFPVGKPPAFLTIDDRAWQFTGVWPDVQTLKCFQPWHKKGGK